MSPKQQKSMRKVVTIGAAVAATLGLGAFVAPHLCGQCFTAGVVQAKSSPPGNAATKSVTVTVEGMTCASCSVTVRMAAKQLDGVKEAKVSVPDKQAVVEYDPAKVTPEKIVEAINKAGYRASLPARVEKSAAVRR